MLLEKLLELSQHVGMTLEKAAKLIMQRFEHTKQANIESESKENKVIPFKIQEQLQQRYSVILKKINQEQQKNFMEMEQRLSERKDQKNE